MSHHPLLPEGKLHRDLLSLEWEWWTAMGWNAKQCAAEAPKSPARRRFWRRDEGQSLVEVAVFVPLFTMLMIYAVDFGFFFLAATTLTSAARNATSFAIQGVKSPSLASEPAASLVKSLAIAGIGLPNASSATVQVCSNSVGTPSSNNIAQCTSSTYAADTDPESPTFQLNRVDIVYTVTPPIPLPAAIFPHLTFHRYVEMRAIQ